MAVLYNFWTIIFRTAFKDVRLCVCSRTLSNVLWGFLKDIKPWANVFTLVDYLVDFIYIVDVFVQFHVGYLEHGILVSSAICYGNAPLETGFAIFLGSRPAETSGTLSKRSEFRKGYYRSFANVCTDYFCR